MIHFFGAAAAALFLALAGPSAPLTAEELATRNVEARGGAAAIRALGSLRLTGKVIFGGDDWSMEMTWTRMVRRPGMQRTETAAQGMTALQAWDGREAWQVSPFGGRKDPERMPADASRLLALDADLDGPLLGWKEKGGTLASLGTEDVDGTAAHKLQLTRADGTVQVIYLDPVHFLEIRVETRTRVRGAEVIVERDLGNYEQVAGVWIPFAIEAGEKGGPRNTRISVSSAAPGLPLDEALFRFPTGGAVVAAPPSPPVPPLPAVSTKPARAAAGAVRFDAGVLSGLGARNIGSAAMSGRIAAIAAHADGGKTTLFVGAASGGVWKSVDGGTTFRPVFDLEQVQSIGAIAVDPRNPRSVWVGTGEPWTRNSVSIGDGVYRSTDGGESWTHVGLRESERVARIVIDPRDSETAWACVPGKLWSDSADRGLYKTTDGGKSWALVLPGKNLSTGCSSVSLDPRAPDRVLAGLWDFRRQGWTFRSGGAGPDAPSGSGLFRSEDGGRTWSAVAPPAATGLPPAPWGRVEVTYAPSDPLVVYAFIEASAAGLYRSADGGRTWEARDRSFNMVWRPFYFARLVVDPGNPDRLFKTDLTLIVSEDGGRSFAQAGGGSHGDWHDLWIDPRNPKHVIGGDDGGLWISQDGGSRWWKGDNLPISQFYHVSTDGQDPYRVYGGLQDNGSWTGPSTYPGAIPNSAWELVNGSDGFWTFADPADPDCVYAEGQGGYLARLDRRTRAWRDIQPKAGYGEKLRFNWNTPIHLSPSQPGVLYLGAQFLMRTRDRGETWERLSPDLTTNDPERQKQELSGGITVDNSSAEMHTTLYAIAESPQNAKVIWVGTDDGNLQLTRDAGRTWTNVAPNVNGLPPRSWVSWVEASRFDEAVAYAAFDRHTLGDMSPWVYRTADHGATWTRVAGPEQGVRGFAHVVREDTVKPSILYLGTELGLWITLDAGRNWAEFKGGRFPSVAVRDLVVHPREHDLVIGTHGRGIWIVDDLTPLRALSDELLARDAAFLPGRPSQQRMGALGTWVLGDAGYAGESAPGGAVITYFQRDRHLFGPLRLEVLDADGKVVDTIAASKRRGLNRVTWSMRLPPPRVPRAAMLAGSATQGPRVLPGTWRVVLVKGNERLEGSFQVTLDRRAPYGVADRKAQLELALQVNGLFERMSSTVDRLEALRQGAEARAGALPAGDPLAAQLRGLAVRAEELRGRIVATREGGAITGEERLRENADLLYGALLSWEGRPAMTLVERTSALERELGDVTGVLDRLIAGTLPGLDRELGARGLPPVATAPEPPPGRQVSSSVLGAGFSTFDGQSVPHLGKSKRR